MERRNDLPAKVWFSLALILVASLVIACTSAAPAPAAKPVEKAASQPITLKAYTAWSKDLMENMTFWKWIDELKARKSDVTINWIGGPEAIPPFESMEALRTGAVDIIHTAHDYNAAIVPAAFAGKLTPFQPKEERENGWNELLNKAYAEKGNAIHLARGGAEMGFRFYTNVEIKSISDFKGLRIRVSPVYKSFVEALGAQPVTTAPGEVYTAMERKVVDGFGWPEARITDLGAHEVTKYVLNPPFYNTTSTILVNLDSWKKLSKAQQDVMVEAAKVAENSARALSLEVVEKEEKILKDKGLKFNTVAESEKYIEMAYKASWDEVVAKSPDWGPKLRELASKASTKK